MGSLIHGQRGESGLLYRRNGYYDPATGQFTQEDPIGLAGGLNLYGFAGGDPVNFSDPFGLCPEEDRDEEGLCPGGLTVDQWQVVEELAARLVRLSEASTNKAEYGRYVMGTLTGRGYLHPNLWGGGSNTRLVGHPYYGGDLPVGTPAGAVALVHTHPYPVTADGRGRIAILPTPSDADRANAMWRGIPVFSANRNGTRVVLPSGEILPKTWPLGGRR